MRVSMSDRTINNKNIILMQAVAAALMGSDYFMPKAIRVKTNEILRGYFSGVRNRSYDGIGMFWKYALSNKWKTIYPTVYLTTLTVFVLHFGQSTLETRMNLALLFLVLLIGMFYMFLISIYILDRLVSALMLNMPLVSISYFLERTEKGPLAAIGFIILVITFILRYLEAG